jgi:hypothetical protein
MAVASRLTSCAVVLCLGGARMALANDSTPSSGRRSEIEEYDRDRLSPATNQPRSVKRPSTVASRSGSTADGTIPVASVNGSSNAWPGVDAERL